MEGNRSSKDAALADIAEEPGDEDAASPTMSTRTADLAKAYQDVKAGVQPTPMKSLGLPKSPKASSSSSPPKSPTKSPRAMSYERRTTMQIQELLEDDPNVHLDTLRNHEKMKMLYLGRQSETGPESHHLAQVCDGLTLEPEAPTCVCGESLDVRTSSRRLNLARKAARVHPARELLNHNPLVLKLYFDYCAQLDVRPNSGFHRFLERHGAGRSSCFCAMEEVRFSHFGLGDDGFVPVARLLEHDPALQALDISDNGLTDGSIPVLIDIIKGHDRLVSLDLGHNCKVTNQSLRPLLRMLMHRPNITSMGLEGTGLGTKEREVIYMQLVWNSRAGDADTKEHPGGKDCSVQPTSDGEQCFHPSQSSSKYLVGSYASSQRLSPKSKPQLSSNFRRVRQLADRFEFFKNAAGKSMVEIPPTPSFPGPPASLDEDVWDRSCAFDIAVSLHKRWVLECSEVREDERRKNEEQAQRIARQKSKASVSRWGLLARMMLDQMDRLFELELLRILRKDVPTCCDGLAYEARKLEGILKDSDRAAAAGLHSLSDEQVRQAKERLASVRTALAEVQHRMRMMRVAMQVGKFAAMARAGIEKKLRASISVDLGEMNSSTLEKLAAEILELVDRGVQQRVDEALLSDAELFVEEILALVVKKKHAADKFRRTGRQQFQMRRFVKGVQEEVTQKRDRVEANLRRMVGEGNSWHTDKDYQELVNFSDELYDLVAVAEERFKGQIDPTILEQASALSYEVRRYCSHTEDAEERMATITTQVSNLMRTAGFKSNERTMEKEKKECEGTAKQIEEWLEEKDIPFTSFSGEAQASKSKGKKEKQGPAERSGRGFDPRRMLEVHMIMVKATSALQKNAEHFGIGRAEAAKGVHVGSILPLQDTLNMLIQEKEKPQSPARSPRAKERGRTSDLDVLSEFAQTIQRYGYASLGKAFESMKLRKDQEDVEVPLEKFQERVEKLGVKDPSLIERMYQLIRPFTYGNFRRLLCTPFVTLHVKEGGDPASPRQSQPQSPVSPKAGPKSGPGRSK